MLYKEQSLLCICLMSELPGLGIGSLALQDQLESLKACLKFKLSQTPKKNSEENHETGSTTQNPEKIK